MGRCPKGLEGYARVAQSPPPAPPSGDHHQTAPGAAIPLPATYRNNTMSWPIGGSCNWFLCLWLRSLL